ncbi:anthocyanin 5-aromatic acyltransferase [Aegilops tauschii subsp. strangulata]|uniref:Anthocyanin 5-aromatic acyltransferase n=1 Tax=Aegilops tauschii subsp. strangulata TaxID=200361 RepID=A0A453QND5_AEGTS
MHLHSLANLFVDCYFAMSSRVRLVNVTRVHPACAAAAGDLELAFFDIAQVAKIPIQRLFFFDGPGLPPFPSVVSALRSSLADTLAVFFPLAGELAFRPSSGAVVVDCSPAAVSSGVRFVEAEYMGGADDMRRLAREEEHDTEAFSQLVPDLDVAQLPARVLAVQVTRPAAGHGAVAVGVTILHAVADGQAVWQFMRAWSTASRAGAAALVGLVPPPTFDRSPILQHPIAAELSRTFLRFFAPALPLLRSPPSTSSTVDTAPQIRRTFVLTADQIRSLKQQCVPQSGQSLPPASTYVAISSLVWASIVRAKSMDHADDTHFMVAADCRRRLRPAPGEGYFGNCIRPCFARANVGELRGEGGVARAAAAIRERVREDLERTSDPLEGMERVLDVVRGVPRERLTSVASSHRFMAYETDFGWGAPSRVELVSMFAAELVTLLGAKQAGAVQVSVALRRHLMEAFAANFLALAGSS